MNINKPKLSKPKIGLTLAFMLAYTLLSGWAYFDFVYHAIFSYRVGEECITTLLVVAIPSFIIQLAVVLYLFHSKMCLLPADV